MQDIEITSKEACPFCGETNYNVNFEFFGKELVDINLLCPCGWTCVDKQDAEEYITYKPK